MKQPSKMHIEENPQHRRNPTRRETPRDRRQQTQPAQNLCHATRPHQSQRMRIMVRHDVQIKIRMPEVIDSAGHIKNGLNHQASPGGSRQHLLSISAATPAPITASEGSSGNTSSW